MTSEVIVDSQAPVSATDGSRSVRSRWLPRAALCLLLAIGMGMRLYQLGQPLERDFDEGVYLQSLRAMSHGFALYSQVFYSQPPFFLESVFPIYMFAGQSLWAGRLAVALLSLWGLLGAWLLGKALYGYKGAFVALLLTLTSVSFLHEARVLQADGPSVALSLLGVGLAFQWWKQPTGRRGLLLAALSGISLALSIMTKFLVAPALLPVGILVLMRFWQLTRPSEGKRSSTPLAYWAPVAGIGAFVLVTLALFLPWTSSFSTMFQSIVSFHTKSNVIFRYTLRTITFPLLLQGLSTPLTFTGLAGIMVAVLRRDWRVIPLFVWFLGTILVLLEQRPLFAHHLVALVPPLVSLSVLGCSALSPLFSQLSVKRSQTQCSFTRTSAIVTIVLAVGCAYAFGQDIIYLLKPPPPVTPTGPLQQAASDLKRFTQPGDLVISDEPLAVALAGRDTPPWLVDPSSVRIQSGYLTLQDLIKASEQPQVRAVLFFSSRFHLQEVEEYHSWVTQHFHLVRVYGKDSIGYPQELWVR
ncbi:ArnT family glycosyltransferase [Thermogemmatispora sp.]|uniref:ArnT family glycosyltransferase n=1 Tax=Thermogemmatispora sp. TaxID=1968838 RepID=UPI001DE76424|nr:phospholipid carrier-dependent glycosyltransferase [Thermogemmatispora sp.]MBX5448583.1 phospholipid carrier-dependent glycosyltransferase [Thermogemmatispora sp.]